MGYGNDYTAPEPRRIATISAGYADGVIRAMGPNAQVFVEETRCPVVGRISMDLIGIDITGLRSDPKSLELLGLHQSIDTLAEQARHDRLRDPHRARGALHAAVPRGMTALLSASRRHRPQMLRSRHAGPGAIFAAETVSHLARPPFYLRELGHALVQIGWLSLPVVGMTALFTGGALALQIYAGGARFNAETVVPPSSPSGWCGSWARCWAGSWWPRGWPRPSLPRSAP